MATLSSSFGINDIIPQLMHQDKAIEMAHTDDGKASRVEPLPLPVWLLERTKTSCHFLNAIINVLNTNAVSIITTILLFSYTFEKFL